MAAQIHASMPRPSRGLALALLSCFFITAAPVGAAPAILSGTQVLTETGDLSHLMRAGIHQFLTERTEAAVTNRLRYWHRDLSSAGAYARSVETNRQELVRIIGVADPRPSRIQLEVISPLGQPAARAETELCSLFDVRWSAFGDVHGEGILLRPKGEIRARVVVIPDAAQTPELSAGLERGNGAGLARRLAEAGCEVLVPVLVNRSDAGSGNASLDRWTNQPHREWIYRQAFPVGRHIIGFEVSKVLAALDWFAQQPVPLPIGLAGYGEGGMIAFYTGAIDNRADVTLVSGYFQSRQKLWLEPIYRNVFGLLRQFGDAEIASLIVPRSLVIEHCDFPEVTGPPTALAGRNGAAPGRLDTPEQWALESEILRLGEWFPREGAVQPRVRLVNGSEGAVVVPGSRLALLDMLKALKIPPTALRLETPVPWNVHWETDASERQLRQVRELELHTQQLLDQSASRRDQFFWSRCQGSNSTKATIELRQRFTDEVVGRVQLPLRSPNPRSRLIQETASWNAYEVTLDVWPEVFTWGILLLPKDNQKPRPVVICQHGLEGLPQDTVQADPGSAAFGYYHNYAARLAERGYVVFSPNNLYRGGDDFRQLQRQANPLGLSLYSIMLGQHEQILSWLSGLPFVDPKRIGFYGLSYGGKSALYLPAMLEGYALSICSANFNDWAHKLADTRSPYSYMFTGEYEMPEFNLANTFSHAELAALISPRPFMVERGHQDGVAPDEWVAAEYAKVKRHYLSLGIPDRTQIDFFAGGHSIHGEETFQFLDQYLKP